MVQDSSKTAKDILDIYFLENRARLLEIASFLDRIDRYKESSAAKNDFRYKAFIKTIKLLLEAEGKRTKAIQLNFSDLTEKSIESAVGLKAVGVWEGPLSEDN